MIDYLPWGIVAAELPSLGIFITPPSLRSSVRIVKDHGSEQSKQNAKLNI